MHVLEDVHTCAAWFHCVRHTGDGSVGTMAQHPEHTIGKGGAASDGTVDGAMMELLSVSCISQFAKDLPSVDSNGIRCV